MEKKIHTSRACVKVSLEAICKNVKNAMDRVGPDTKMMVVIKTDAYGHGAVAVAKALCEIGVYAFAVATIDEAIELREAGIKNPLLILGYVFPEDLEDAIKYDVTIAVSSVEEAEIISAVSQNVPDKTAKVHIKLDTGMGRIGFNVVEDNAFEESVKDIETVFSMDGVFVEGVFSHFACADETDKASAMRQLDKYKKAVEKIEADGYKFEIKHLSNSAGIMDLDVPFSMVRSGIITYGLLPSDEVNKEVFPLYPAMSIVSHISHVKKVGAGFTVSYGSTFTTEKDTVIATVPFGYGDGYPRSLSNKACVLVNGKRAKILGRVCMDQFMVDVTDIPDVHKGSEVVLVGKQGNEEITVEELAEISGRFNYEFVCDINKRVPRVYN